MPRLEPARVEPDNAVIIDEAYAGFGAIGNSIILANTTTYLMCRLSKSRSFAGGRLGFAVGDALIEDLTKMHWTILHAVNAMSLILAEAAVGRGGLLSGEPAENHYMRLCSG